MTRHRDRYEDVGRAMRQAIDRALAAGLGERQMRTFLAVLRQTASYSKLEDRLYLAALAEVVFGTDEPERWHLDKIGRDLKQLAALEIVEREPPRRGRPKAGSGGARYRVALPPAEMRPPTDALSSEKYVHDRREMRPLPSRNAPAGGRPTEEVSEEGAEVVRAASVSRNGSSPSTTPPPTAAPAGLVLPRVDKVGPLEWCRARVTGRTEPGELEAVLTELRAAWPDDLDGALSLGVEGAEDDGDPPLMVRWPRQLPAALAPHLEQERELREQEQADAARADRQRCPVCTAADHLDHDAYVAALIQEDSR